VLLTGITAFSACSLVCAVASSRGLLLGARALQGVAGAVVSPATLSIITATLPEGPERNRGLGWWGAIGGLGASSGALLGGILTQTLGWQAIFAVNVPLGAIAVALGLRVIPPLEPNREFDRRHFDVTGAVLVTAALATLTFGIVRTGALGWGSPGVLVPLAAGALLLAAFVYVEARVAPAPLVPLRIFRLRRLRAANAVIVLLYLALFSMWYFLTLYLQTVRREDAIATGLSFAPMTMLVFAGSTAAPALVRRFGVRPVLATGMSLSALGLIWLSGITPTSSLVGRVLPGGMVATLGMGLSLVPATIGAMQGVSGRDAGVASGLLNTSRLIGGALGLAILGTLAQSRTHDAMASLGSLGAQTAGYQLAFTIGAVFCLAGAGIAAVLPRAQAPLGVEASGEPTVTGSAEVELDQDIAEAA
jgi:EmrB/QacA subfamily drug resistance transporter